MPGDDLPNLLSVISIALTIVVIYLAGRTVREAAAARKADRRHRQLQQLRAIHHLVLSIGLRLRLVIPWDGAWAAPKDVSWRCGEQDELGSALVGVQPPLPECRTLAAAKGMQAVKTALEGADAELRAVFRSLGAEGG